MNHINLERKTLKYLPEGHPIPEEIQQTPK